MLRIPHCLDNRLIDDGKVLLAHVATVILNCRLSINITSLHTQKSDDMPHFRFTYSASVVVTSYFPYFYYYL
jgi:hypothetical protein